MLNRWTYGANGRRGRPLVPLLALLAAVWLIACGAFDPASAQRPDRPPSNSVTTPGNALGDKSVSELWQSIRQGRSGTLNLPDPDGAVLMQSSGNDWRLNRDQIVSTYGKWTLAGVVALIVAYFLIRGRIRLRAGRSGRVIPRFSLVQRVVHWFMAVVFIVLGLSGLVLMFGRTLLKPLIGADALAVIASASMQGHNLFGPLLIPATIALFVVFVRGNGYRLVDLKWLFKFGGFLGGHASSHKYNFGEKTWFWSAVLLGIALSVTGMAMLFPAVIGSRELLQLANLVHAGAAVAVIAFAIGHIYLGTIGMEGALEGMTNGTVDENWANEHHDLWYEAHKDAATTDHVRAEVTAAAVGDAGIAEGGT